MGLCLHRSQCHHCVPGQEHPTLYLSAWPSELSRLSLSTVNKCIQVLICIRWFIYHFLMDMAVVWASGVEYQLHGVWFVQLLIASQSTHHQYLQRQYCCTADGMFTMCRGVSHAMEWGRLIRGS